MMTTRKYHCQICKSPSINFISHKAGTALAASAGQDNSSLSNILLCSNSFDNITSVGGGDDVRKRRNIQRAIDSISLHYHQITQLLNICTCTDSNNSGNNSSSPRVPCSCSRINILKAFCNICAGKLEGIIDTWNKITELEIKKMKQIEEIGEKILKNSGTPVSDKDDDSPNEDKQQQQTKEDRKRKWEEDDGNTTGNVIGDNQNKVMEPHMENMCDKRIADNVSHAEGPSDDDTATESFEIAPKKPKLSENDDVASPQYTSSLNPLPSSSKTPTTDKEGIKDYHVIEDDDNDCVIIGIKNAPSVSVVNVNPQLEEKHNSPIPEVVQKPVYPNGRDLVRGEGYQYINYDSDESNPSISDEPFDINEVTEHELEQAMRLVPSYDDVQDGIVCILCGKWVRPAKFATHKEAEVKILMHIYREHYPELH